MKQFKFQGIVFYSRLFFEKDKLIDLFSPEFGKLKVLVKGAGSIKSRYGGVMSAGCWLE